MPAQKPNSKQRLFVYLAIFLFVSFVIQNFLVPAFIDQQIKTVAYSEFVQMVDKGEVVRVEVKQDKRLLITTKKENTQTLYNTWALDSDKDFYERLEQHRVEVVTESPQQNATSSLLIYVLIQIGLPILLVMGGMWFIRSAAKKASGKQGEKGGSFMGGFNPFDITSALGKAGDKEVKAEQTTVTFKDVAGQDEAKASLAEIVDLLKYPERYQKIGAKCPKGALLVGPPGTGKTLLAKAVAGEAHVPFFQMPGSEFIEMLAGRGAARVRDLFEQAQKKAPCIVFIDEIDAIGKRRDSVLGGNSEQEQTLNQLLAQMDGFDTGKSVVVLAATNRPEMLDQALMRPGRFDRKIPVELPDLVGREEILKIHGAQVKLEHDVDLSIIAKSTPGASGADLANIVNEAALRAVRYKRNTVTQTDLSESVDVVIAGEIKKSRVLDEHEKEVVSYHETGHAIVAAIHKGSAPVSKITIVPRTSGALGFTMQVEEKEKFLTTKQEAIDRIAILCAGRAAEELIFGEITTGAADDINKATQLARAMVTQWGMTDRFGMMALGERKSKYLGGSSEITCSEGTAQAVDDEVHRIISAAHDAALTTLKQHRFKLHEIAHYLQRKETITGDEFMNILTRDENFPQETTEEQL